MLYLASMEAEAGGEAGGEAGVEADAEAEAEAEDHCKFKVGLDIPEQSGPARVYRETLPHKQTQNQSSNPLTLCICTLLYQWHTGWWVFNDRMVKI